MYLRAHTGEFLMSGIFLLAGVLLLVRYRHNRKWNWAAAGVLALVGAVYMAAHGWLIFPKATAERFIQQLRNGQYDEANLLLSPAHKWELAADGGLTVRAEDGTSVTLPKDSLPLVPSGKRIIGVDVPGRTLGDILCARLNFQISPSRGGLCYIECTAKRGAVRCRHVELSGN